MRTRAPVESRTTAAAPEPGESTIGAAELQPMRRVETG